MGSQEDMMKGILPGIIAGFIFLAFAGPGMNMDVGGMIGAGDTPLVGFIIHIIISAVIGALYTGVYVGAANFFGDNQLLTVAIGGLIYGLIWWIIGGNIIMPAISGGDILSLDFNGASLIGHIIFGHTLAWIVASHEI
ncbi:MAG: hypothetical protein OXF83_03845 [Anaerolineaceae bacterium]|nr:hypothetical protein [Anaerolineaceae bacterium]MCY3934797.1 hypothetical protein [Chloroflexota bacterium]MCY4009918.1 hypothetical protein [Anaerolineaceae bacterium]